MAIRPGADIIHGEGGVWLLWLAACGLWIDRDEHRGRLDADLDGVPVADDCDDGDPDVHEVQEWFVDGDGDGLGLGTRAVRSCNAPDGWVLVAGDCDDADPDVFAPAAWYVDGDGDGVGGERQEACGQPPGTVAESGDCDDTDPAIRPGGTEVCNGVDDDCDGQIDDADPDRIPLAWYRDRDGDGWGTGPGELVCEPPDPRWALDDGDCDDDDPAVNPGALEVCDGIDNDCDDATDDADPDALVPTWYADADSDGWGAEDSAVRACVAPLDHVGVPGDCDDLAFDAYPREYEQLFGLVDVYCDDDVDHDCDGLADADDPDCQDIDEDGAEDGVDPIRFIDGDGDGDTESVCVRADLTVSPPWSYGDAHLARSDVLEPEVVARGALLPDAWCVDLADWSPGVHAFRFVSVSSARDPAVPVLQDDCRDWVVTDLEPWCDIFGPADPACERADLDSCDDSRFLGIPYDLMAVEVDWDGERARPAD